MIKYYIIIYIVQYTKFILYNAQALHKMTSYYRERPNCIGTLPVTYVYTIPHNFKRNVAILKIFINKMYIIIQ